MDPLEGQVLAPTSASFRRLPGATQMAAERTVTDGRAVLSRLRCQIEVGIVGSRTSPHRFLPSFPERTAVDVFTVPSLGQIGSVVRKRQPTPGLVAAAVSRRDDRHRVDRNFHSRMMALLLRSAPLMPLS